MHIVHSKIRDISIQSRFRGCMLGSAIGDALGMPSENMTRAQIINKFGDRIDRFYPKPNRGLKAGQWTDDTLLSLATVDSLIEEGAFAPHKIAKRMSVAFKKEKSRGFGRSTKIALRRLNEGYHWQGSGITEKSSAGNGAAMRIYPIALSSYGNLKILKDNCEMVSSITHKNPEAINGALAVAFVISSILNSKFNRAKIIPNIIDFIGPSKVSEKLLIVQNILNDRTYSLEKGLERIGTFGSVFETVPSSLYVFLHSFDSFEEALISSVSYGGDTDTIGAIVGAMSGTYHGDDVIPKLWKDGVEDGEIIKSKADKLFIVSNLPWDTIDIYRQWQSDRDIKIDPNLLPLFEALGKKD